MSDRDPTKVSFTLLENGLDFVLSAVEQLSGTPSRRQLKYAVLHLYSGAVLILKERLSHDDWKLLFANPERAEEKAFKAGTFRGPDLDQCLERLEAIDIAISDDHDLNLRLLADKRKRLEHFHFSDSVEAIIALTADVLNFLVEFVSEELDGDALDANHARLLDELRRKLTDFSAFVEARWEAISEEIESAETVTACPACLEEAWVIQDGAECKFCGHKGVDSGNAADQYVEHVMGEDRFLLEKDGGVWPVRKCPSCNWNSLVDRNYVEHGPQYICFECGSTWNPQDLSNCSRCGELKRDNDMAICDGCFREVIGRDPF